MIRFLIIFVLQVIIVTKCEGIVEKLEHVYIAFDDELSNENIEKLSEKISKDYAKDLSNLNETHHYKFMHKKDSSKVSILAFGSKMNVPGKEADGDVATTEYNATLTAEVTCKRRNTLDRMVNYTSKFVEYREKVRDLIKDINSETDGQYTALNLRDARNYLMSLSSTSGRSKLIRRANEFIDKYFVAFEVPLHGRIMNKDIHIDEEIRITRIQPVLRNVFAEIEDCKYDVDCSTSPKLTAASFDQISVYALMIALDVEGYEDIIRKDGRAVIMAKYTRTGSWEKYFKIYIYHSSDNTLKEVTKQSAACGYKQDACFWYKMKTLRTKYIDKPGEKYCSSYYNEETIERMDAYHRTRPGPVEDYMICDCYYLEKILVPSCWRKEKCTLNQLDRFVITGNILLPIVFIFFFLINPLIIRAHKDSLLKKLQNIMKIKWFRRAVKLGAEAIKSEHGARFNFNKPHWKKTAYLANTQLNQPGTAICYDKSRVKLTMKWMECDYIHANYIHTHEFPKRAIMAQGPMKDQEGAFWTMIWQEDVDNIVMLCDPTECADYYPTESGTEREFYKAITVKKVEGGSSKAIGEHSSIKVSKFVMKAEGKTKKVNHYYISGWEKGGIPNKSDSYWMIIDLWMLIRKSKKPIVIHSLLGKDRAGTFMVIGVMLDRLIACVKAAGLLVPMHEMAVDRGAGIESFKQYLYAYRVIMEYCYGRKGEMEKDVPPEYMDKHKEWLDMYEQENQ